MLPKKKSGSGPQPFNDRVRGAEESARELSARVEAFLAELARPPDPPPWSPPPDTGDEVERLRALLASSQRHALVAENRAEVAEEQLSALEAFCARLERSLAESEARAAEAKEEEGQACISGLLRGSGLLGMKVNGHGNELGHIADLLFDAARMRASHFVIDAEKFFKDSRHCIPFAQLRRVDQDANEATFDLTTESLQSAPKCADMEEIDQSAEIILPGPYYHVGL